MPRIGEGILHMPYAALVCMVHPSLVPRQSEGEGKKERLVHTDLRMRCTRVKTSSMKNGDLLYEARFTSTGLYN